MSTGHHEASWRLPESDPFANTDVQHYVAAGPDRRARRCDSVFLADCPALWGDVGRRPPAALEPTVLLAAMAMATEQVGLIATASTTYNEPFNLARRFASLDHLSGGRAGWNIVTTAALDAARNFNLDELPGHRERYRRADEFVEVAASCGTAGTTTPCSATRSRGRWGDQRPGAPDRPRRQALPGGRARSTCPASPQGDRCWCRPGRRRTAGTSPPATPRRSSPRSRRSTTRRRSTPTSRTGPRRFGRDPDLVKILPGIVPVIGSTEAEALALEEELDQLIQPEYARDQLAQHAAGRPRRPGRSTASCPPTCPTRTRSRAPSRATR